MKRIPTDEAYWKEYDGLQHAKHQLLRSYLGAWFPILGSWAGKVLYIDCHAGRGRHKTGHEGSPILALRVLLGHRSREAILKDTEVTFVFLEIGENNFTSLSKEIESLGVLPPGVVIVPYQNDYETFLRQSIKDIRAKGQQLAPAFAFVDPYGFTIPMDLLNALLDFPACELFINFMFRYVDMAINLPSQEENMDSLFGCKDWRELSQIEDIAVRAESIITLYSRQLKAKFVTHMHMRGKNNALKYVLFHATNHPTGRERIKAAMWKVTPDGSFTAFERNHPEQLILIQPEPDLSPLEDRLWHEFAGKQVYSDDVHKWLVRELYLPKHLHQVLSRYRNSGIIGASEYGDRFAYSRNPLFSFPEKRPES